MIVNAEGLNKEKSGFALVATISVMVLLLMVLLVMLSLTAVEVRSSRNDRHQQIARSHARMALMIAIGELQKVAGPDQRVTARADLLGGELAHRNWLGVWKTTYASGGREWPIIGKSSDPGEGPYPHNGIYSDLRVSESSLNEGKWRDELLLSWLVSSRSSVADPKVALDIKDTHVVELLGQGTLGRGGGEGDSGRDRVLVEKVDVQSGGDGGDGGSYAWYISDNNQKASIALDPYVASDTSIPFLATQGDNPTSIQSASGAKPFASYVAAVHGNDGKVITDQSAGMVAGSPTQRKALQQAIGAHFHHFTTHGAGLFVDVAVGGFKKDLAPLLFGDPARERVSLAIPDSSGVALDFSSDDPIIPGSHHAVLGPSFGALRYWGRLKSLKGISSGVIDAQVDHQSLRSIRVRSSENWPYQVSDGVSFDGGMWASMAPKVHPVMTDVRWHYYFSHTDDSMKQSFRTHLIPRVCMWNPYQVSMRTRSLVVLMPNPYWKETNAFHFHVNLDEAKRLKVAFPDAQGAVAAWGYGGYHKIRARGSKGDDGAAGLFPDTRYLGFMLEPTLFAPGECLVFSPRVDKADASASGVSIQRYHKDDIASNILSAAVPQGEDHFFHDYESSWLELQCVTPSGKSSWRKSPTDPSLLVELKLSEIDRYEPAWKFKDNFPFILKSTKGSGHVSAELITSAGASRYPTLQLMNHGNGGVKTFEFSSAGAWGPNDADPSSGFKGLATFAEEPRREAPALHQVGAKLLWLDESSTEANQPPLRQGGNGTRWNPDHLAFNPASIAQWNVRPGLITRSPCSPCAEKWYAMSAGAWMLQFSPRSPQCFDDLPSLNATGQYFRKSPFAAADQFSESAKVAVLFDLPDPNYGALSVGALRHAQLSPYSWHPSYIVSHSLADIHAPFESSANPSQSVPYLGNKPSGWDAVTGGEKEIHPHYGSKSEPANSAGLLQIGKHATQKSVWGAVKSSKDEVLAYDIAFEVNLNLWDSYFFSGIPMKDGVFSWDPSTSDQLWNHRYQRSRYARIHAEDVKSRLHHVETGLAYGFWNNASLLKNRSAFNVNSTSVQAWTAFLSGLQGVKRKTSRGLKGGDGCSVFSRVRVPQDAVFSNEVAVDHGGGWGGGRILTECEIHSLAMKIVQQVKARGPFVSLADFVNRRLAPKSNPASRQGVIDQAIADAGLNDSFRDPIYQTTRNNAIDNNHEDWRVDLDKQPESKAWGIPGYLTQGDILEPMAPAMTVRGDSFLIRTYGESRDAQNNVMATAYLEAVVERTSEYVASAGMHKSGNLATEPMMRIDRPTGAVIPGKLSQVNQRFGRKFKVTLFRWLSIREV